MSNLPNQWNILDNGFESKWWPKSNGNIGLIYRPIGQSSNYPHDTEFLTPNGNLEGGHKSSTEDLHNFNVQRNLAFYLQNDPSLKK